MKRCRSTVTRRETIWIAEPLSAVVNSSTLRPTAVHSSGLPNQVYLLTFLLPGKLPIISHKFPTLFFIYTRKINKARGKMVDKLFTTNKENVIINVTVESSFLLQYLSCGENLVEKISVDRVAKYRSFVSFKNYFIVLKVQNQINVTDFQIVEKVFNL